VLGRVSRPCDTARARGRFWVFANGKRGCDRVLARHLGGGSGVYPRALRSLWWAETAGDSARRDKRRVLGQGIGCVLLRRPTLASVAGCGLTHGRSRTSGCTGRGATQAHSTSS